MIPNRHSSSRAASARRASLVWFAALALPLGIASSRASAQEAPYPTDTEIKTRYDFAAWPGATGPVWAGVPPQALEFALKKTDDATEVEEAARWAPRRTPHVQVVEVRENNPYRETRLEDFAVRLDFMVAQPKADEKRDHLRVEINVTRSRADARLLLLNQFLAHHSLPPIAEPHLPWGEVRLSELGDVAFVNQKNGLTHRVCFVRGNLFVRIDALGDGATIALEYARQLDRSIEAGERAPRFEALAPPPVPRFAVANAAAAPNEVTLVTLEVANGCKADWIAPHGDLVRDVVRKGDFGYVPREAGPLSLVVIDGRGHFAIHELWIGAR
ncbi:MAG: hypothetical protein ACKVX7_04235 [Planctomycetota bacterium]